MLFWIAVFFRRVYFCFVYLDCGAIPPLLFFESLACPRGAVGMALSELLPSR
jgi:hypothetical protein